MRDSFSETRYTVDYLMRKARSVRLQANRAAPSLAAQLIALAKLYETQAEQALSIPPFVPSCG